MAGVPPVINVTDLVGWNGFRIAGSGFNEAAGSSVASAGDLNGDGFADVIVGAPGNGFYTNDAAYVFFGRAHEDIPEPSTIPNFFFDPNDSFKIVVGRGLGGIDGPEDGFAVSSAGDFNGDGFGDLMVSTPSYGA